MNKKMRKSVLESDSSDLEFSTNQKTVDEKLFLPTTFEGMMEAFGVN